MTVISYVTQKEMEDQTGFKHALGYALPEEDKILLRDGLSHEMKKKVLAHEEEHIRKGEEGPWVAAAIAAGTAIYSAVSGSKSSKKASKKAKKGSDAQIEFAREAMEQARADTQHTRQAGATALNALMSMTGLSGPGGGAQYDENGWPIENQGGGVLDNAGPVAPQEAPAIDNRFADNAIGPPGGPSAPPTHGSAYNLRYAGGPTSQGTLYNVNEMGPENVYSGGAVVRNGMPRSMAGQNGYVQPNIQGRVEGGPVGYDPGKGGGGGGGTRDFLKGGAGHNLASGGLVDPITGGILGNMFGGSDLKRGVLPDTEWQRGENGRIMGKNSLPQGHWNPRLGQYVDRRGRPKKNQAAPPEGWEDPNAIKTDIDTTQGTDFNFKADPGYQFRFEEGQRALDRGAAARGGLLSGGYGRKAMRYGQGFASNEYTNVYNRIAGIAGMGQVANQHAGNAAMAGGQQMGAGAAASGINSAYGPIGAGNAEQNALNNLGDVDWDSIFNRTS